MSTFDIRNVIGALIGLYGIVLCLCFFLLDPGVNPEDMAPKQATDNLWTGLAMVGVAAVFFAWARFKPIRMEGDHA
ncbi:MULTISPECIES: cell wall anchor protein [unclassified Corynebacterium]|uniref:cell wall anchor protein n=1 Tax=unclassified Corynebacterium TaxID=2624378 RepID=UPI0029CA6D10|nr:MULTISPECIES: cell wall anchor protein [unclassified Corynebacterium]WPF67119.1 cell wall anchor protein [Corynebacterium sp. 22KM0430]WPF69607.1 cell wall anchor protein [Corynebacterium sp. 21KM1197]